MRSPDRVTINTDTVFDEEGVPVSLERGAYGRIVDATDEIMVQVLIWWAEGGPEIVGVPREYLSSREIVA